MTHHLNCPQCRAPLHPTGTLTPTGRQLQIIHCPICGVHFTNNTPSGAPRIIDSPSGPIRTARPIGDPTPTAPIHPYIPYRTMQRIAARLGITPLNQPKPELYQAILAAQSEASQ